MNQRRFISSILTITLVCVVTLQPSWAIVVFDPSNFTQNILSAIRTLQSNINEARLIANQITSLTNEAKNLSSLNFDITEEYSSQFSDLFSTVGTINGLMQDLNSLQSNFEELYPDFTKTYDPIKRSSMSTDIDRWIQTTRDMMLGASKTGAQVLKNLPSTQVQLEQLMRESQGAEGILQATQAGNQIAATISGNLTNLNAQLASYTQAHTAYLMQITESSGASKNRMNHVLDGITERYQGSSLPENPF